MRHGDVFTFAGLWVHWVGDGQTLDSCSIIVMLANEFLKPLHDRMPAIFSPTHYGLWLDSSISDKPEIMQYLNLLPRVI